MTAEKYDAAYCEDLHGKIMDEFHKFRKRECIGQTQVLLDGILLSQIIASAKRKLYAVRPDAKYAGTERNTLRLDP